MQAYAILFANFYAKKDRWYQKKVPFIDPTYFCQKPLRVQRYNNFLTWARKKGEFSDTTL